VNVLAIYYNGKTSVPNKVILSTERRSSLSIRDLSNNSLVSTWTIPEIEIVKYRKGEILQLGHSEFPMESLRIDGPLADELYFEVLFQQPQLEKISQSIFTANPVKLVLASVVLLFSVLFLYIFVISPWVAERAVDIIPRSAEVTLGKSAWNMNSKYFNEDSLKSELLQEFYERCGFTSEFPVKLHYIDQGMVNAFAFPGGNIAVFEGIIDKTSCWSELAGIIAHESSHVNQRHSLKLIARSVASYLVLSVITGDVAGASGIILENLNQVNQMSNTRAFEKEADIKGLEMLAENKIDPYGLRDVFLNILDMPELENSKEGKVLTYLSTHPLSGTRVEYIEEIIRNDDAYNYPYKEDDRLQEIWEILKSHSRVKNERLEDVLERADQISKEDEEKDQEKVQDEEKEKVTEEEPVLDN